MNGPTAERGEASQGRGSLVYVVDDEPMLVELASIILEPLGYRVETFRTPEAALRAFEAAEQPPALIVTDYAMPGMNGLELVEACRRVRPEQRALLISGTAGPEVCLGAPAKPNGFLAKPYQSKQLVEAVAAALAD